MVYTDQNTPLAGGLYRPEYTSGWWYTEQNTPRLVVYTDQNTPLAGGIQTRIRP